MWESITALLQSWLEGMPALWGRLSSTAEWAWSRLASTTGCYSLAVLFGAVALAMLFPGPARSVRQRVVGVLLFLASAALFFGQNTAGEGGNLAGVIIWLLTVTALLAGVAMVTSRKPVYSAIWFALTLLAVGGLFLTAGAQFLGIATVAVYAGAIVVTFLFVLMLAQPGGHAMYDRITWGWWPRFLGSLAAMLLVALVNTSCAGFVAGAANRPAPTSVLATEHVARLGGLLFSKYLIEIQVAGTLLLVALVGAVAMASQRVVREAGEASGTRVGTGAEGDGQDV